MNENFHKMLFSLNSYKNPLLKINYSVAEIPYCSVKWKCQRGKGQMREWVSVCDSPVKK